MEYTEAIGWCRPKMTSKAHVGWVPRSANPVRYAQKVVGSSRDCCTKPSTTLILAIILCLAFWALPGCCSIGCLFVAGNNPGMLIRERSSLVLVCNSSCLRARRCNATSPVVLLNAWTTLGPLSRRDTYAGIPSLDGYS
jgi:hypothetical protein